MIQTRPLGSVVDVSAGHPAPNAAEFADEGIPFVRAGSLERLLNGGSLAECEKMPEDAARKNRLRLFPKDTVVFAKSGMSATLGRVYRLSEPAYVVSHLAALVPTGDYDPGYLTYWLRRNPPSHLIKDPAYPSIRISAIEEVQVPDVPLKEQRHVAAILDKANGIRRKRDKSLAMARALLNSVFLEFFGDPIKNQKCFEVAQLGELVEASRGISYGIVQRGRHVEGGIPVVRISNIVENIFCGSEVVYTDLAISNKYKRTILKGGELLLSIRGTVGRVAMAPASAAGWNVSREVAVIPLKKLYSAEYIHTLMMMPSAQYFMSGNVKGVAQRGINLSDVRKLPVPIPPNDRLIAFLEIYKCLRQHVINLEHLFSHSDEAFGSLSQRAFRGEL
jgi:type I restriction enzyme S subunit